MPEESVALKSTTNHIANRSGNQSASIPTPLPKTTLIPTTESPHPHIQDVTQSPMPSVQASQPVNRRVPYFRYFGPTAIAPGYKQMVVSMQHPPRSSALSRSLPIDTSPADARDGRTDLDATSQLHMDLHIYDLKMNSATSPLILHLVDTFFAHLGSSFPFLNKERLMSAINVKEAEPILIDALCSLAARFSDHPLLSRSEGDDSLRVECGNVFAQRAKTAVIDTFPCPTITSTQACLLLAYQSFGAGQDSALWMYLGCAIRMAVDTGLHKITCAALQADGDLGLPGSGFNDTASHTSYSSPGEKSSLQQDVRKERIDTFWAVFILDRVVSTGVGRPVTLKEKDFELPLPRIVDRESPHWPAPYLALIQIINLYGHMSDAMNAVRDVDTINNTSISTVEQQLTTFYNGLDQRLVFNATNFQHYVKAGEGTSFILLHFWFHTLIILVHQPMLLKPTEIRGAPLSSHSRELSMSSAKTIADILQFAELIDPKSFLSNPFTCQPLYISACAFLAESVMLVQQNDSSNEHRSSQYDDDTHGRDNIQESSEQKSPGPAVHQNYAKCHRGLQQIQSYWSGAKYIVTALEQRASGIWDPETYTTDEMESTKLPTFEVPKEWKRKVSPSWNSSQDNHHIAGSVIDQSHAIGWSLTGTTNSPTSNLTFLYPSNTACGNSPQVCPPSGNMVYDPIRQAQSARNMPAIPPATPIYPCNNQFDNTAYLKASTIEQAQQASGDMQHVMSMGNFMDVNIHTRPEYEQARSDQSSLLFGQAMSSLDTRPTNVGGMFIESQDVDMSALDHEISWLEYIPNYGWNACATVEESGPLWMNGMVP